MNNSSVDPIELAQRMKKTLVLSSRKLSWNGILVEQYQKELDISLEDAQRVGTS
ncbi:MAG TPA: hypothetical protein V6C85_16340 [Allocoleopsis sp.]